MSRPTAVIAEDEPLLRDELQDALATLWPELELKAEAEDGIEALRALEIHEPDILFLDIEMPGATGLDVARVASGRCHVVFVTAFEQYAVAAFEQGAVDYVVKPFAPARLASAITRVKERLRGAPANLDRVLKTLAEQRRSQQRYLRWISVAQGRTVRLITVEEVCYFQADNKYTTVVTASSRSLINKTIKELADELDPTVFLQVHRSTIVNVNAISAVHRDHRGRQQIELKHRQGMLPVSASFAHLFRQM
jgi:DNA-binding LytR/AlgR family response regulator